MRKIFPACCPSATWTDSRAKPTSKMGMVLILMLACLLRFIAGCPEPFFLPVAHWIWDKLTAVLLVAPLVLLTLAMSPLPASAWNIPGHMLSGAIAYQVLQRESPQTIDKVKAVLEKHPWYSNQWQARLQDVSVGDHSLVLFMQAARWADDIRSNDKQQHRALWHYINWPFKPDGQPATVQTRIGPLC